MEPNQTNIEKDIFEPVRKTIRLFVWLFIVCLLIFVFSLGVFLYGLVQTYLPLSQGQPQIIEISRGQGVKEIAQNLENQKLIRSSFWMEIYAWLSQKQNKFQAGQYLIDPGLNIAQIVEMISQGRVMENEIWITIPEGFTSKQIKDRLIAGGLSSGQSLGEETIADFETRYQFLSDAPDKASLEGFLFPDTYKFKKDISGKEVLIKMLDNLDGKLTPALRTEIKKQGRSVFEVVTMASLLEKEVKTKSDRKIVAGIFWKRIKDNYPLESDATLSYIFEDKKDRHTLEETKVDSPYNTYRYSGLPPGPINNPGLEAIEAAIYPQDSPFYFFLTKPGTGEVVYGKTLQEHNANKAKYLK